MQGQVLKKLLGFIIIISLSSAGAIAAQGPVENQRLCQDGDLAGGSWKEVQFIETPPHREAAWVHDFPYQYLSFYQDHYYSFVATNREYKTPKELAKAMQLTLQQKHAFKYTLDNQGVLNLYVDQKVIYSYRCLVIKKTQSGFKKDDLVLTAYTKRSMTLLYKLYRRWF